MTSQSLISRLMQAARLGAIAVALLLSAMLQTSEASMVLAWDPSPEPEVIGYRVYVGTEPGVYSEFYDVPADNTWFVYTASKGGLRYYFAVAARAAEDVVSPPSNEVTGVAQFIRSESAAADPRGSSTSSRADIAEGRLCLDAAAGPCYSATLLAGDLGVVSSLAATGDGRVLFIEDHRRVRILTEASRTIATAHEARPSNVMLTGLAVDPAFTRSHLVFVGESAIRADGRGDLSIVRYRELGGTLGEGAAPLGSLSLPPAGRAPFTVDAERNVYVAMPAGAASDRRNGFAGQVLGFTADGRTLPSRTGASPIIALGGARPSALVWDAVARRLWVSDAVGTQSAALAHIDLANPQGDLTPGSGAPALGFGVTAFAMAGPRTDAESASAYLISSTRRLYHATLGSDSSLASLIEVPVTGFGEPVAMALGSQHELYVAVRLWAARTESPRFAILRLR